MNQQEGLIPIEEAVKRYGISRDGIYYYVRQKKLTTYRVMGHKRAFVKVADMDALRVRPSSGKDVEENPKKEDSPRSLEPGADPKVASVETAPLPQLDYSKAKNRLRKPKTIDEVAGEMPANSPELMLYQGKGAGLLARDIEARIEYLQDPKGAKRYLSAIYKRIAISYLQAELGRRRVEAARGENK